MMWHRIGILLQPLRQPVFSAISKVHRTTRPRVGILCGDEVLLVQNWGDRKWSLPGGGAHRNEDHKQAAIREIKEELGLDLPTEDVKPVALVALKSYDAPLFIVRLSEKPQISPQKLEIAAYNWCHLNEIPLVGDGTSQMLAMLQNFTDK